MNIGIIWCGAHSFFIIKRDLSNLVSIIDISRIRRGEMIELSFGQVLVIKCFKELSDFQRCIPQVDKLFMYMRSESEYNETMKYIALLLLLISPLSHAGDLEFSGGIALSNVDLTSATWAKPGCCYTLDFQDTKLNNNGSFGIFGGKLSKGVYFAGPTYSYALGPISIGTAVGVDRDHGS